ncbi:Beta-barrel assembly machine subunit BamE [Varunaivibrio sulfuroxidans]|uniref:Beta-barrel assembly machine subunit BamE n=2 Tax=Varunaivibrio sulfuroxidans TaxID=1773489 RepID=A0A4R3J768_9PROT|nr:Beta-barrel assembly machine subunit BamE [Varunaivibrio sulfuroxidans]
MGLFSQARQYTFARGRKSRLAYFAALMLVGVALTACAPRIETHGSDPDPAKVAEIVPGDYTKQTVKDVLGSPSSVAVFDKNEVWYYITEHTATEAFFKPKVTARTILVIAFDNKGVVRSVKKVGLDQAQNMTPVTRETPTAGNELTLMQQLLGNLGRFEDTGKKKP